MQVIRDISTLKKFISLQKQNNVTIGLVPTMGYLHSGHYSLLTKAKELSNCVIVSIFVNPLQFGPNEDLTNYPRNLAVDIIMCETAQVDVVFVPEPDEIYPKGTQNINIVVSQLGNNLCGGSRVGHFNGVCIIVAKLFNLILPDMAFFGKKDIQQLRIIETLVNELNFPVKVVACDTVRDKDGLALSSRNSYLSKSARQLAIIVPNLLKYLVSQIEEGQLEVNILIQNGINFLTQSQGPRLDYLQIVDYSTLQPLKTAQGKIIIATAIYIGKTRLIDNIILEIKNI